MRSLTKNEQIVASGGNYQQDFRPYGEIIGGVVVSPIGLLLSIIAKTSSNCACEGQMIFEIVFALGSSVGGLTGAGLGYTVDYFSEKYAQQNTP